MTPKNSPRSRKNKRFDAASIPALAPQTLKQGRRKQNSASKAARRRHNAFFSLIQARAWGLSHYFAFLLLLASFAALTFLFTDSQFSISTVTIGDNGYIDTGQIQRQSDIAGANIFTIDPAHVAIQLATALPQIKKTQVRLGLPNRAAILVEERQPVLIYGHGSQTQWADAEGRIFPPTEAQLHLPLLIDEDGSASIDGIHMNPAIWQAIQQIRTTIPDMNEFHHRDTYGLFFISPEGWRVYFGEGENMQNKLAMWQTLRQQMLQQNRVVKIIDLRYDRVYIQ